MRAGSHYHKSFKGNRFLAGNRRHLAAKVWNLRIPLATPTFFKFKCFFFKFNFIVLDDPTVTIQQFSRKSVSFEKENSNEITSGADRSQLSEVDLDSETIRVIDSCSCCTSRKARSIFKNIKPTPLDRLISYANHMRR